MFQRGKGRSAAACRVYNNHKTNRHAAEHIERQKTFMRFGHGEKLGGLLLAIVQMYTELFQIPISINGEFENEKRRVKEGKRNNFFKSSCRFSFCYCDGSRSIYRITIGSNAFHLYAILARLVGRIKRKGSVARAIGLHLRRPI